MISQRTIRVILSLLIVVFFLLHAAGGFRWAFFESLEAQSYDFRLRSTMPNTVDRQVVIVDLDERSLAEFGRWPWSRHILADMVDILFDHYNIRVLGFDVVFAEPDQSSGIKTLESLASGALKDNEAFKNAYQSIRPSLEYDERFARSLRDRNTVLGYYFKAKLPDNEPPTVGTLPAPLLSVDSYVLQRLPLRRAVGFGANLPLLQSNSPRGGFFDNPLIYADGLYRRLPMIQSYKGELYGALSLEVLRALSADPTVRLTIASDANDKGQANYFALERINVGGLSIPVDEEGAVLIPYRGKQGSFPYLSAADVLNKKVSLETLENAVVLVGTTAAGLLDLRATPVQKIYPGVEVHANIISGALNNRFLHKPAYALGYEFLLTLICGLAMTLLLINITPFKITLITCSLIGIVSAFNIYAWSQLQLVLPAAVTILMIVTLFIFHISFGFFVENRGKRQLTRLFGQYIPAELVKEMDKAPQDYTLEGESREMSVLFSDVRGFTGISETLEPKELTALMNAFLTPMTGVIHEQRGTIDKYMGDAVMAFWGAPLNDENHAKNALLAAIKMIEKLNEIQPDLKMRGWPEINVGVGINTGNMRVGNMGSEFRMAYTVLGDAVNIGSRLEGLTSQYDAQIIVSGATKEAVPEYRFRELDRVTVKGKEEPVTIYEPIAPVDEIDTETKSQLMQYHSALKHYRDRKWDDAEQALYFLYRTHRKKIYKIYLQRIAYYRKNPPSDDWNGVFRHQNK